LEGEKREEQEIRWSEDRFDSAGKDGVVVRCGEV